MVHCACVSFGRDLSSGRSDPDLPVNLPIFYALGSDKRIAHGYSGVDAMREYYCPTFTGAKRSVDCGLLILFCDRSLFERRRGPIKLQSREA